MIKYDSIFNSIFLNSLISTYFGYILSQNTYFFIKENYGVKCSEEFKQTFLTAFFFNPLRPVAPQKMLLILLIFYYKIDLFYKKNYGENVHRNSNKDFFTD